MRQTNRALRIGSLALLPAVLLAGGGCGTEGLPDSVTRQLEEEGVGSAAGSGSSASTNSPSDRSSGDGEESLEGNWRPTSEPIVRPVSQWTLHETAADALGRMGRAAVPLLIEKLRAEHPDPRQRAEIRRQATYVLARIGPDAEPAVPALTEALNDPSLKVRKGAAFALGQIGPAAAGAAPALLRIMLEASPDPDVDDDSPGDDTGGSGDDTGGNSFRPAYNPPYDPLRDSIPPSAARGAP